MNQYLIYLILGFKLSLQDENGNLDKGILIINS